MLARISFTVAALAAGLGISAQNKLSGTMTCGKPVVKTVEEAKDAPGHMLVLQKSTCGWISPTVVAGVKPGPTTTVEAGELRGSIFTARGYSLSVMQNGDTTVGQYDATMHMNADGSGAYTGTWSYVRGTGKFSGIAGRGTFKGSAGADGTDTTSVTGTYTLPVAKR